MKDIDLGVCVGFDGTTPRYATPDSAAFDLAVSQEYAIGAGGYLEMQFDLVFDIPEGHMLYVRPRNSTFRKHGLIFVGSGIVDKDFRGPLDKINFPVYGTRMACIPKGERIAQGVLVPVTHAILVSYDPSTAKNRGGTGSTGRF